MSGLRTAPPIRDCLSEEMISVALAPGAVMPAHVASCARCRHQLEETRRLRAVAQSLPWRDPSAGERSSVRAQIMARVAGMPARPRPRRSLALTALAAAILVGVAGWILRDRLLEPPRAELSSRGHVEADPGASFDHELRRGAEDGAQDEIVWLSQGTLHLQVDPLGRRERFRVLVADGEVEVRGTKFGVTAEDGQLTDVSVEEGLVVVRIRGQEVASVSRGERWSRAPGDVAAPPAEAPRAPPLEDAPASSSLPGLQPDAGASEIARRTRPRPRELAAAGLPPLSATGGSRSGESTPEGPLGPLEDVGDPADGGLAPLPTIPAVSPDAGTRAASPLDASGSSDGATRSASDPVAAEAAFRRGWSLLRRRSFAEAAAEFAAAEARAGASALAEDAGYWRLFTLRRLAPPVPADAYARFVQLYGESSHLDEVSLWLAESLRDDQPGRARALCRVVIARGDPRWRGRAEELLGALE
ncbi:MAG: FecR domain-containing protein [Deltaproteobacteria bacterium]|nr:FecR domain-containing protein [Deltaproteobacteria bacterium]